MLHGAILISKPILKEEERTYDDRKNMITWSATISYQYNMSDKKNPS